MSGLMVSGTSETLSNGNSEKGGKGQALFVSSFSSETESHYIALAGLRTLDIEL